MNHLYRAFPVHALRHGPWLRSRVHGRFGVKTSHAGHVASAAEGQECSVPDSLVNLGLGLCRRRYRHLFGYRFGTRRSRRVYSRHEVGRTAEITGFKTFGRSLYRRRKQIPGRL